MKKFSLLLEMVVNFVLPWLCYRFARASMEETAALMVSAVPPILWSLFTVIRFRRLDAVSLLVLGGILLSFLAMLCGGGPRLLLLRESLITGVIGLVLLISLLFPRPLMYYMAESTASKHSPEEVGRFELLWEKPRFVHCMYLMTTVWGVGLVCEAIIRAILAWTIPTERFLLISPIVSYGVYLGLMGWTFWVVHRLKTAQRKNPAEAKRARTEWKSPKTADPAIPPT
jgi:hypothetical protein